MKKYLLTQFIISFSLIAFTQDVKLTDSVIYINDKPVAFYYKELNSSILKYNIDVTSLKNDYLIKAEVIKFNAPVDELKPFFYYELTFPAIADTFAIYLEDEAFPLALGKLIRDYKLISNDQLDRKAVANFKANYAGGPMLEAKIQAVEDYLDQTRYFYDQVKRDRTKPVTIINERVIMQDGVKIGTIHQFENLQISNQPIYVNQVKSTYGKNDVPITTVSDYQTSTVTETQIFFANGRKMDYKEMNSDYEKSKLRKETGRSLYEISRPKDLPRGSYNDNLLRRVCFLIEEYAL